MQLGRENLCAAKNTGDGRKERYDKEKSVDYSISFAEFCKNRFAPLRRSLIGDTTHYLQGAAVLTGLLYHVVLYHVDSRARLAGSGAQGD